MDQSHLLICMSSLGMIFEKLLIIMSSTLMLSSALKSTKKYHNLISVRVTGVSCAENIADYIL